MTRVIFFVKELVACIGLIRSIVRRPDVVIVAGTPVMNTSVGMRQLVDARIGMSSRVGSHDGSTGGVHVDTK